MKKYLFSWDSVPGDDDKKLKKFLRDDLDIDWAENAEIRKSEDGNTIHISKNKNSAEIEISKKKELATLTISSVRTPDLIAKNEGGKRKIYMEKKEGFRAKLPIRISMVASVSIVIIMILALLISCYNYNYMSSPGDVKPLNPSGYGFIRGIHYFPSDHIVLPLEWENRGGTAVTVRHPYLVLRELRPDGNKTNYCFFMAGEYSDISTNSFDEFYSIKDSFIVDPHSITKINSVFHIKDWWNDSKLFCWDNVPGNDNDSLLRFLRDDLDIDWAENAEIRKSEDGNTIHISKNKNSAEIKIDEKNEKATLKVSDGKKHNLTVNDVNGKRNMYDSNNSAFVFRFTSGMIYSVYIGYSIGYQEKSDWQPVDKLFNMTLFGAVDDLKGNRSKGRYWDYFYDNQGACNITAKS